MTDVILDTLFDLAKLLPFLFLAYLLMEFLEHKSGGAAARWLGGSGKIGPLLGGALGAVPQCGFSAAASGLYTGRIITAGTLIAVYLSTSDEMLPILVGERIGAGKIFAILGFKILVGVLAGFAVDFFSRKVSHRADDTPCIEEVCEREHCKCGDHFALSALKHTLRIALFLLIFSFVLNTAIHFIGEENLARLLSGRPILGSFLAVVVGLIPNCASSVLLTELWIEEILPVGAMLSGLLVNAGVGLALLFRNNRPVRDSFRITLILVCVGVAAGVLVDLTPLQNLFA